MNNVSLEIFLKFENNKFSKGLKIPQFTGNVVKTFKGAFTQINSEKHIF